MPHLLIVEEEQDEQQSEHHNPLAISAIISVMNDADFNAAKVTTGVDGALVKSVLAEDVVKKHLNDFAEAV